MEGIAAIIPHKQEIIDKYLAGMSSYQLAKDYNTFPCNISRILNRAGYDLREANPKLHIELSKELRQVLDGWMLGDGHMALPGQQSFFSHVSKHEEYRDYVSKYLENVPHRKYLYYAMGNTYYRLRTCSTVEFAEIYKKWYKDKKKIIPEDIKLSPLTVNHWFMDDGTMGKRDKNIILSTNCFTKEECDKLSSQLNDILNAKDIHQNNRNEIYLSRNSANKFLEYAGECKLDCFKYKWGR